MTATGYAWLPGWDQDDGDLILMEDDFIDYMVDDVPLVLASQPLDRYPVRDTMNSGRETGDGTPDHAIIVRRATRELSAHIENTYLSSGTVVSTQMTVRLFLHDLNTWRDYNCWFKLYSPSQDGNHELKEFIELQLRFRVWAESTP